MIQVHVIVSPRFFKIGACLAYPGLLHIRRTCPQSWGAFRILESTAVVDATLSVAQISVLSAF